MKCPNCGHVFTPVSSASNSPLAQARVGLQMTRKQLAIAAGVSEWTIQRMESGRSTPTLPQARALAHTLRSTVDALFPAPAPILEDDSASDPKEDAYADSLPAPDGDAAEPNER